MTRINTLRNIAETRCSVSGNNLGALLFAAVLIVCSVTVGCSSDKPKPVSSNHQIPTTQAPSPMASMPAPALQAENKPAVKKVVHKKPATANYADKTYGVTFEYPRRYAIETGDAAADLLAANPIPMNFIEPGGIALAAVELPETGYVNTDFSSAFFNVSVHKTLTADQCNEFAVPQPKVADTSAASPAANAVAPAEATSTATAPAQASETQTTAQPAAATTAASTETAPAAKASTTDAASASAAESASGSKLLLGDMELRGTEAVSGEGTRQSDSKYFHVYQNGACYEFVLNVTTVASEDGLMKHVDRDKVFNRLEQILATVKINSVAPEATADAPATPAAAASPAQ
jgi:hypothetical protein